MIGSYISVFLFIHTTLPSLSDLSQKCLFSLLLCHFASPREYTKIYSFQSTEHHFLPANSNSLSQQLRRREVSLIESQNRNVQSCKRRAVDCRKKRARYYEQCALTFLSFYSSLTFIKFIDLICMHYIVFLWQKNREFYKSKNSCFANFLTKLSHPDPSSKRSLFNSVHGMLGQMLSSTWPPNCPL